MARFPALFEKSSISIAVFLLSVAALIVFLYYRSYREFSGSHVLGLILTFAISFSIWAGIWSFISRLVAHQFRFFAHLGLAGMIAVLFLLVETFFEYVQFLYSPALPGDAIELPLIALVFFLLLFGHLSLLGTITPLKRLIASLLVAIGIFGSVGALTWFDRDKFSAGISFPSQLKPVNGDWLTVVPAEAFFSGLSGLKQEIAALPHQESSEEEE